MMKKYTQNEQILINRINKEEFNIDTLVGEVKTASRVTIECHYGHKIETNLGTIIKTARCMQCEKERLNIELFKLIESYGYDTANIPLDTPKNKEIEVKCMVGHKITTNIGQILKTKRCMRCEKVSKYYEIVDILDSYGFTMLSKEDDYISTNYNIDYLCNEGHEQSHNYNYFIRGHKCSECFKYKGFDKVTAELIQEGYTILTNKEEYKNTKVRVRYICPRGHEHSSQVCKLLSGGRCGKCQGQRLRQIKQRPIEDIIEMFNDNGYRVVNSPETYENGHSIFSVECPKYHIYETTASNFRAGYRCKRCAYDNNSGEGNVGWKGGITPLHNRIRERINPWKLDSMKSGGYRCFISGLEKDMIVHHAINFSDILMETLTDLHYEVKEKVNQYSEYELEQIEKLCLKKHYDYGLGIIMTEDLHIKFHQIYGFKNNTLEQVLEFKEDYLNGKYPELNELSNLKKVNSI